MTACLILVDVENLRPSNGRGWSWRAPGAGFSRRCGCSIDSAVVVLALSTRVARSKYFESPEAIPGMVADVLGALGLSQVRHSVEVVLALSAPEAADRALIAACRTAPEPAGTGPFEHVALLSNDKGLRKATSRAIRAKARPQSMTRKGRPEAFLWCLRKAHSRGSDGHVAVVGEGSPPAPSGGPVVFVDREDLALWAGGQTVQVGGSLASIARAAENDPALLTQVAPTHTGGRRDCARGVGRLARVLRSGVVGAVGPCSRKDGLELRVDGRVLDSQVPVARVEGSPLGNGAVRVWLKDDQTASLRTNLPAGLVKRALEGERLLTNRVKPILLDDGMVLQEWDGRDSGSVPERRVRFIRVDSERGSFCEIGADEDELDSWWYWIVRGTRRVATVKPDLPRALTLEGDIKDVPCRPVILKVWPRDPALGWRVVDELFESVLTVPSPIAGGKVGMARWKDRGGRSRRAALLALDPFSGQVPGRDLRPVQDLGGWASVRPILQESLPAMDGGQWFRTRLLPLVVAGWPV